MKYSELLQLAKSWGNFISDRIIIWRLHYKKKNVYLDNYSWTGLGSYSYERISKRTLGGKLVCYNHRTRKWATTGYTWNNKSVSKAYFDRALKRVVGKTRFTKYKFYKNTLPNRRRYLK